MEPLIVANWKCNPKTKKEAEMLLALVKEGLKGEKGAKVVICPPFVYLSDLSGLALGAQNCFWEEGGAYTGEISVPMIKDSGSEYVIVGHSERRKYFGESDETVSRKLKAVLKEGLTPILCVGETQQERDSSQTEGVLKRQITLAMNGVLADDLSGFVLAYEPVWAIGTGNPCDQKEAGKMLLFIRKVLTEIYGSQVAGSVAVLYGGSVNSKNSASYIKEAKFQGLLVGGASLKADEFIKLVKSAV